MVENKCPCLKCDKRNAYCHGECEEYKKYAKENAIIRKKAAMNRRNAYLDNYTRRKRGSKI